MASLTISIVNWNTRDDLARCLESLYPACEGVDVEIIVVDNASTDGSAAFVAERFPDVRLIALDENVGFAAGNNLAIREGDGDYVLILNPDIRVQPTTLRELLKALDAAPEAAAVGATMVGTDGRIQTEYYRRFPSRLQVALFYTTLSHLFSHIRCVRRRFLEYEIAGTNPVQVDQLPGACILVRRSVLDEIGLLDPDFFIWFEDVDWCYRMRQAGYRLYALPWVRVHHAGAASLKNWSVDRRLWQFFRAYFRFLCKHQLENLIDWSFVVIRADLVVKRWIVRLLRFVPVRSTRRLEDIDTLSALRDSIRNLIDRHHAGELVRLTAADAQPPAAAMRLSGVEMMERSHAAG